MDLQTIAPRHGGAKWPDKPSWQFPTLAQALECARELGATPPNVPEALWDRRPDLRSGKDGILTLAIPYQTADDGIDVPRAAHIGRYWCYTLGVRADQRSSAEQAEQYDDIVRMVVSGDEADGWHYRDIDGRWISAWPDDVRCVLLSRIAAGTVPPGTDDPRHIMGWCAHHPWKRVSIPLASEYPGGRRWNRGAPQLRCQPAPGHHPHWDLVLEHLGGSLTPYIPRGLGIDTGGQYLAAWIAYMLRHPAMKAPYLFFYGPQGTGKSLLHEAISECLVTSGVVMADRALGGKSDFNGELSGALLGIVEEKDVRSPTAAARMKSWVTGQQISIRRMRSDSAMETSYLHFCQMANERDACPVFGGDTRVTMIECRPFVGEEIPKTIMLERLTAEAPAFLHTLFQMTLPEPTGRLCLPIIETPDKQEAMADDLVTALLDAMGDDDSFEFTVADLRTMDITDRPKNMRAVETRLQAAKLNYTIHRPKNRSHTCEIYRCPHENHTSQSESKEAMT